MLSANFKPKRTAAASRGFLATARLSCYSSLYIVHNILRSDSCSFKKHLIVLIPAVQVNVLLVRSARSADRARARTRTHTYVCMRSYVMLCIGTSPNPQRCRWFRWCSRISPLQTGQWRLLLLQCCTPAATCPGTAVVITSVSVAARNVRRRKNQIPNHRIRSRRMKRITTCAHLGNIATVS